MEMQFFAALVYGLLRVIDTFTDRKASNLLDYNGLDELSYVGKCDAAWTPAVSNQTYLTYACAVAGWNGCSRLKPCESLTRVLKHAQEGTIFAPIWNRAPRVLASPQCPMILPSFTRSMFILAKIIFALEGGKPSHSFW